MMRLVNSRARSTLDISRVPAASNPLVTAGRRYVFRSCFSDDFQGRVMARFAREDLGARTAAVVVRESVAELTRARSGVFEGVG